MVLVTLFSLLLLGTTRSFANPGSGGNNQNSNSHSNSGGGLIGWIDSLLDDIFGGGDNKGGGNGNSPSPNSIGTPPYESGGGGTAPIDGGLSLLLAAGIGLGIKKAAGRKDSAV